MNKLVIAISRFIPIPLAVPALLLFTFSIASGQVAQQKSPTTPRPNLAVSADKDLSQDVDQPMSSLEEEMRAKRAIRLAEKEHEENLSRAREIGQLGREIKEAFKNKSALDREIEKRLDRIEKLTRKIRGDAGGEDNEVTIEARPSNLESTVTRVVDASELLSKNVQSTPRQVVSATVINDANVLLELIRILRGFAR